ncbi:hypothetical protein TNCT_214001 [Trichonephila clavata]|uniref:Uncharacterized protein n=1 Tax=Trichonephila clavata TaxID=2740835 RepID=A0A8X6JXW3_TRICU|nr:hypothetical protein TNCT_214001 [Trichonephila clavata]
MTFSGWGGQDCPDRRRPIPFQTGVEEGDQTPSHSQQVTGGCTRTKLRNAVVTITKLTRWGCSKGWEFNKGWSKVMMRMKDAWEMMLEDGTYLPWRIYWRRRP